MLVGIGKQPKKTGSLNGIRKLSLIIGFRSGNTARDNFPCFRNVIAQGIEILVINLFNVFCCKPAKSATSEKSAHTLNTLNSLIVHEALRPEPLDSLTQRIDFVIAVRIDIVVIVIGRKACWLGIRVLISAFNER